MKLMVFGAGALGSLFGARLARKHDVTLVARPEHARAIRAGGLVVSGHTETVAHPRAVASVAELDPAEGFDAVLLTVKSQDTAAAMEGLAPLTGGALLVSVQNGLGNLEVMAARAPRVVGGVTYNGVTLAGPGRVEHAGEGETVLGPWQGTAREDAAAFAAVLGACGLPTRVSDDVREELWTKAVVNACFNPLTGLLGVLSGALAESPPLEALSRTIVEEAVAVAAASGVALEAGALLDRVRRVALATAGNRSSMLQDLSRGRATEIDAINGAVAALGEAHGVACPVNRALTLLVKAAEGRGGLAAREGERP